jgi:arylsulfate sulfotransferase
MSVTISRFRRCLLRSHCPNLLGARLAAVIVGLALVLWFTGCANVVITEQPSKTPPPSGPPPQPVQNPTITLTPEFVALAPGQGFKFVATASNGGTITWSTNSGTVDSSGNYMAPATVGQSENAVVTAALASAPKTSYATAIIAIIQPGQAVCPPATGNPQVAQYSIYLPSSGSVSVQFGTSTSYGLTTWSVPTPTSNGGQVKVWVAGMRGLTLYHMRAQVQLTNGATYTDQDLTCTTGKPPVTSPLAVTTGAGTPQSGIEFWNTIYPASFAQAVATDLQGNVIWTYNYKHNPQDSIQGFQVLPNGDFLLLITYLSSLNPVSPASLIDEVREIDLAGNTVRSLTMDTLNQKMAASNLRDAQGNVYQFKSLHHDVLVLPNGHWVLLTDYNKKYTNLPGTTSTTTSVLGDGLVDVDQNGNPDWAWNTFDHLDINRRPMGFPDWTHGNGMVYSSDDHNLFFSMRHQNWIIKIEFLDGAGSGKVMWRLGQGGDFKLENGKDPTDWFYAQHGMNFFTANTTGVFRLGMFDNGNDRLFPWGKMLCAPANTTPTLCYSTVPVLEINENAMTATLVKHYIPSPNQFSFFGGNAELLANGDIETDFAATNSGAIVQELDPSSLKVVWQGATAKAFQYHASRAPSLYPGVQW